MAELSVHAPGIWEDGELVLCRSMPDGEPLPVLAATSLTAPPSRESIERLQHAYKLRDQLDSAWAARPLRLVTERGRLTLLSEDPGGEPLLRLLGQPWEITSFLRFAIGLAAALARFHERGLIHKDIKPANILVNKATWAVWLTGFGIASHLSRERQPPGSTGAIAGTLPYMAPEQTGRMNRSIDSRSDLYACGITLYETITGSLPFSASDPLEWIHCHIARPPNPPSERVDGLPGPIEDIILKLLAKSPEDRFQTAAGLEADLRACLTAWETHGQIDAFAIGARDVPDKVLIPEKLYGRKSEVDTLVAAFDHVATEGRAEFILVSGHAGVGKSSVVSEFSKLVIPRRGLFAGGKFDQHKRDIPYSTLAQAFQSLVRNILGLDETELKHWRDALLEALGPNGQLMITLIPELVAIIGEQPPTPDLPPEEARNRFQMVFRRFLSAFARPERPLALFLDDLQWLDAATVEIIEHLVAEPDVRYVLLVGSYRPNELDPSHLLVRMLERIRNAGASVQEIALRPLAPGDVRRLIADALRTEVHQVRSLAKLVFDKTGGNAFFVNQFIAALAEDGLLVFDTDRRAWKWDIDLIRAKGFTANVADLMATKMNRLPKATQEALGLLACLGSVTTVATIDLVSITEKAAVHAALWQAVRAGLLHRVGGAYAFIHDRVREAAYALIPESERAMAHLTIGRLLASQTAPDERDEKIFDVVNQLNHGAALITTPKEREQVAEFNLIAGKRAKLAAAYSAALQYFKKGIELLGENAWEQSSRLAFELELNSAECEYLTSCLASAEERLSVLSRRTANLADTAAVACLQMTLYTTLDRSDSAVEVGLKYLRLVGVDFSPHPTDHDVQQEYERFWRHVGDRTIGALIDLPVTRDSDRIATLDVLTLTVPAANFTDENLFCIVVARMASLSVEHGNGDASCHAYVWLGMILRSRFGNFEAGFRFGRLGIDLVEQRGLDRFTARVYSDFGHLIHPWTRHLRDGVDWVRRALAAAQTNGDLTFAAFAGNSLTMLLLASGEPLGVVQREAVKGLEFTRSVRFGLFADIMTGQLGLIRALRGQTSGISSFGDEQFDERQFQERLEIEPGLAFAACWYWIRKLQALFHAKDYTAAVAAADRAQSLMWKSPPFFEAAEYHFYAALARAATSDSSPSDAQRRSLDALCAHHLQLETWSRHCSENFANREALVGAEIARIEGREGDAMRLYEKAVRSARDNGFVQNEALANELASNFYAALGFETISHAYLRNARSCYLLWGADGKVRQMDQANPYLLQQPAQPAAIIAAVEQVDVETMITAAQAVSGEIVLDRLIETLLTIALKNAGAQRGLLILLEGDTPRIEAEGKVDQKTVKVMVRREAVTQADIPESLLHYVVRTRQSVILNDASAQDPISTDDYVREKRARSVLCLPLLKQARLIGVLYLENNLASHVFTPARISILELVASQAAISLENARLYGELTVSEDRWRKLFESVPVGVVLVGSDRRYVAANPAFQKMTGYSEAELRRISPADITHEDDQATTEAIITAHYAGEPYRGHLVKRYRRKDGGVTWAEVDGFLAPGPASTLFLAGVSVDITERKLAEEELRDARADVERMARLTTMGELTASIAHEINQPLAAIVTQSEAALRFLDRDEPDLGEAQDALSSIRRDAMRASEVIRGLRALARKSGPKLTPLDIDDVIGQVLAISRGELLRHNIVLRTELGSGARPVLGDRVQLQQVLLNLIMNSVEAMSGVTERARELSVSSTLAEPGSVLVAVEDTGAGLDPAVAERMFQPFFTTKPDGLGMGLAICRSIVEAHGGRLWVSRRAPHGADVPLPISFLAEHSATQTNSGD
jgi:PAS domain S-box-containing protein